jgi:hypothetical protein
MVTFVEKPTIIEYDLDISERINKIMTYVNIKNKISYNRKIASLLYLTIPENKDECYKLKKNVINKIKINKTDIIFNESTFSIQYCIYRLYENKWYFFKNKKNKKLVVCIDYKYKTRNNKIKCNIIKKNFDNNNNFECKKYTLEKIREITEKFKKY